MYTFNSRWMILLAMVSAAGCALPEGDEHQADGSTDTDALGVTDPTTSSICTAGPSVPVPKKIIYVDKDDSSCSDSGSSNVYCSIKAAVNAISGDGTAVRIRNSSKPYDETVLMRKKSGTAAHPIVIEADPGHKPVLTGGDDGLNFGWGMFSIDDSSHVVVRNLTFNGFGKTTRAGKAIYVKASTGDVQGVVIANNEIINWAGAAPKSSEAIGFARNHPYQVRSSAIRCNTIDKSGRGIGVNGTGALIEYNKMTNMSCQRQEHYSVISASNTSGIGKGPGGTRETLDVDLVIRKNYVSGPFTECDSGGGGLWCDVGLGGGDVDGNTFVDVFGPGLGPWGVHIESRCRNWKVRNNLVVNTKPASQINTYYASYRARGSDNTTFENNVSCSAGGRAYWVLGEAGNHVTIKNNKAYGANDLLRGGFGERGAIINGLDIPDGKPFDLAFQNKMFTDKNTNMGSAACPLGGAPPPDGGDGTTPPPPPSGKLIGLEAEAGTETNPFQVGSDGGASGGHYVWAPEGSGDSYAAPGAGALVLPFAASEGGPYDLWARTIAPNGKSDSFYVTMDGNAVVNPWHVTDSADWTWRKIGKVNLSTGVHSLAFRLREDGTKLDRIIVSGDPGFTPSGVDGTP